MKKLMIIMLALLVVFGGVLVYTGAGSSTAAAVPAVTAEPVFATEAPVAATEAPVEVTAEPLRTLDYDAMYALHEGSDVVMTVDGTEVTWDEYFYWLHYYGSNVEYYMAMYSAYGYGFDWEDTMDEDGTTYLQYVLDMAEGGVKEFATIETAAINAGAQLSEEDLATIEEQKAADIAELAGEGATEEEFYATLKEQYMTPEMYERMLRMSYLYQAGYTATYGEDAVEVAEEEVGAWLQEQGYMAANHILLPTVDLSSYAALTDEEIAANKAKAEEISAELRAITDTEALLLRFAELKAEYDADSGKEYYPNGYTFTSGTMVAEFEAATLALEDYGVSEPVESSYGYHVILRMPLVGDRVLDYSDDGEAVTARVSYAKTAYSNQLQAIYDNMEIAWLDGTAAPALADYLVTA